MLIAYYSGAGWESWGLKHQPTIPERMPILIDDDLKFEDNGVPRATVAANQWLRELPVSGAPSEKTWEAYARYLRTWLEFTAERGMHPFGPREDLRGTLAAFADHHLSGPLPARWEGTTWNFAIGVLDRFYTWAVNEGHCERVPFTYAQGTYYNSPGRMQTRRNVATVRRPKPHVTLKYLEEDFARIFLRALAGLTPDGEPDPHYRGRELGRNGAVGGMVFATGARSQEFTHLLTYEIPPLPVRPRSIPSGFPLPGAITKGRKHRTTWIEHEALADVHTYIDLERAAAAERGPYRPDPQRGTALTVENPDWEGGHVGGRRVAWRHLRPAERLRLVAPDGTSPLLSLQSTGAPFVDWATVFRRTSERVRHRFEPRFPTVTPHTARHTFAMRTLELLVKGYYQRAAALVDDTAEDAALALWLQQTAPIMVLRDLLGHSSVTTTQLYLARLDVQRIYASAYEDAGKSKGLPWQDAAEAEAAAEFDGEDF